MARYTWTGVHARIEANEKLTAGMRNRVTTLVTHLEQWDVPPPILEFVGDLARLTWQRGTDQVRVHVFPRAPTDLLVSTNLKRMATVSTIVDALHAFV